MNKEQIELIDELIMAHSSLYHSTDLVWQDKIKSKIAEIKQKLQTNGQ